MKNLIVKHSIRAVVIVGVFFAGRFIGSDDYVLIGIIGFLASVFINISDKFTEE